MWVKVEGKRRSEGQKFVVRCASEAAGQKVMEERPAVGAAAARRAAEMLGGSLNVTATVYGADAEGEFIYGVYEPSDGAGEASSPVIQRLFAESAAASLTLKDQLIADIPEDSIRGFASLAASLGYLATQHKQAKRSGAPRGRLRDAVSHLLRRRGAGIFSLPANEATLALLSRKLSETPGWLWLSELDGLGVAEQQAINPRVTPGKVTLDIDGELRVLRPRTVFRGVAPGSGRQFMLILQGTRRVDPPHGVVIDSVGLVYHEADEAEVVGLTRRLLQEADPFKNRVVLVNRDLWTVRSRISDRSWADMIPNGRAKEELDFIAASIRDREMLKAEGLTIKRGLAVVGTAGDGKSTAIECFANGVAGEATIIIVEAVEQIRAIYHLAQTLAPSVVILEDLDLMTKVASEPEFVDRQGRRDRRTIAGALRGLGLSRRHHHRHHQSFRGDRRSAVQAGWTLRRPCAHGLSDRQGERARPRSLPGPLRRRRAVDAQASADDSPTRDFARLQIVPAHIEEFVKAGVKRARLARRAPEYSDFEPGIEFDEIGRIAQTAARRRAG